MIALRILTLSLLISVSKMDKSSEKRFIMFEINKNSDLDLSENFKKNFTINYFNGITLLKCSSYCALDNKCLIFSFSKLKSAKICCLFSNDQIEPNNFIADSKTKVYRKALKLAEVSTTTKPVDPTTTTADYTCVNQECTCKDALSFYSLIQNKCIKCRDGWLPYKNICYQSFTTIRRWNEFVSHCTSLNSTLLMPIEQKKFNFFFQVGKNLSSINSNIRLWVSARYDVISVYSWTNGVPINISYLDSIFLGSSTTGFFAFLLGSVSPSLGISSSSSLSNGICEYFE